MSANTQIWETLGTTDPKYTSTFKRAGGFSGTAIKPIWMDKRMTEEFGPCGTGWGMSEPQFQVHPAGDECMVFCTVSIWYVSKETGITSKSIYGVGGDKFYIKSMKDGSMRSSDEAFKMAYTDALSNAMKHIGMGADIHFGQFDGNKYQAGEDLLDENPRHTAQKLTKEEQAAARAEQAAVAKRKLADTPLWVDKPHTKQPAAEREVAFSRIDKATREQLNICLAQLKQNVEQQHGAKASMEISHLLQSKFGTDKSSKIEDMDGRRMLAKAMYDLAQKPADSVSAVPVDLANRWSLMTDIKSTVREFESLKQWLTELGGSEYAETIYRDALARVGAKHSNEFKGADGNERARKASRELYEAAVKLEREQPVTLADVPS